MDDEAKLLTMGALLVLAKSDFISTFLAREREVIPNMNNVNDKVDRKLFDRLLYTQPTWWIILQKGDCKSCGSSSC